MTDDLVPMLFARAPKAKEVWTLEYFALAICILLTEAVFMLLLTQLNQIPFDVYTWYVKIAGYPVEWFLNKSTPF